MRLQSALVLILLAAVSVQGDPIMGSGEQEELEVHTGQLSFTPSNGTLESLLKELGQDLSGIVQVRSKRDTCTSAGPYGGGGGGAFVELPDNCNAVVRRIVIRHAVLIDAIQITYRYSNGREYTWSHRGGTGGTCTTINIDVSGGERIIGIFGRKGALVDNLGFITNSGKVFGPYGGCGGTPFTVNSCNLRGIHGRSADLLDSIGFFCSNM